MLFGARMPGHELTAVIYIDHNLGTVVKDAFPAPSPITEVVARMREAADDPDVRFGDISLADARARVAEAIEVGAIMFPPLESETWGVATLTSGWCGCCLRAGVATSADVGEPGRTSSRNGSSARSSASRSTT
jgi:hypothetical protein